MISGDVLLCNCIHIAISSLFNPLHLALQLAAFLFPPLNSLVKYRSECQIEDYEDGVGIDSGYSILHDISDLQLRCNINLLPSSSLHQTLYIYWLISSLVCPAWAFPAPARDQSQHTHVSETRGSRYYILTPQGKKLHQTTFLYVVPYSCWLAQANIDTFDGAWHQDHSSAPRPYCGQC